MDSMSYTEFKKLYPFIPKIICSFLFLFEHELQHKLPKIFYKTFSRKRLKVRIAFLGTFYFKKGKLHRDKDKPAIITNDGSQYFYKHGERHRTNRPAVTKINGTELWYNRGVRHRVGGPAVKYSSGTEEYWYNGKNHREDGPSVIYNFVSDIGEGYYKEYWFKHGIEHRTDGPSYASKSFLENELVSFRERFMVDGRCHNIKGPADVTNDKELYYINGNILTKRRHTRISNVVLRCARALKHKYKIVFSQIIHQNICKDLTNIITDYLIM